MISTGCTFRIRTDLFALNWFGHGDHDIYSI